MSEPGWAGAGERGRWGPAGRGGKGGGVRGGRGGGAAVGRSRRLPCSTITIEGGGERRESQGHGDRVLWGLSGRGARAC